MSGRPNFALWPVVAAMIAGAPLAGCSKSEAPQTKAAAATPAAPVPAPPVVASAPPQPAPPVVTPEALRAAQEQAELLERKADAAEARARLAEIQLSEERARTQQQIAQAQGNLVRDLTGQLNAANADYAMLQAQADAAQQAAYAAQPNQVLVGGLAVGRPPRRRPYVPSIAGRPPGLLAPVVPSLTPPGPVAPPQEPGKRGHEGH